MKKTKMINRQQVLKAVVRIINSLVFSALIMSSTYSQTKVKYVLESKVEEIWTPDSSEELNKMSAEDSVSKILYIVFEKWFDDSIQIFLNDKILISERIKTNKVTSIVEREKEIKIDYHLLKSPIVEIRLVGQKKKVRFRPQKGYGICYINRLIKQWKLSFSNYVREYY